MILVPSELTSEAKSVDGILENLDSEMMNILRNTDIPVDVKLRQYNQILHRYNMLANAKHEPYKLDVVEVDNHSISDEEILSGIPKKNEKAAQALWRFVKRINKIQIADNGEVILNGRRITGSNIVDLMHDFSRDRKTHKPAKGSAEFAKVLKAANLPIEYVVNKNRYNLFHDDNLEESLEQWDE